MGAETLIWTDQSDSGLNKVRHAQAQSELSIARLRGMKIRAAQEPATACTEHMPFKGHRPVAEWMHQDQRGRCPVKRRGRRST